MPIVYAWTRAQISPLWEIVYYSDTCIVYLAVRETEYFTEILRNIPRMREQWCPGRFFPPPQKKRPGNEANMQVVSFPRPSRAPARKRVWNPSQDFLALLSQHVQKTGKPIRTQDSKQSCDFNAYWNTARFQFQLPSVYVRSGIGPYAQST